MTRAEGEAVYTEASVARMDSQSECEERPLSIPTFRDRVVQMAVSQVIGPIFEVDLLPWQYGFRPGLDAKMALRRIHFGIADRGAREVVDADLSDYHNDRVSEAEILAGHFDATHAMGEIAPRGAHP